MVRRNWVSFYRSERGAAAAEFALILIALFMLIFGVIESGRVFYSWLVITNEAREGARWGAVNRGHPEFPNDATLLNAVANRVTSRVSAQIPYTGPPAVSVSSGQVTVEINCSVEMVTPLLLPGWGTSYPLYAYSQMRAE